jgi:hypothetical protein
MRLCGITHWAALVAGLALGAVDRSFAALFFVVALGYGLALSLVALVVEEYSFHRYRGWRDLAALVAAFLENLGYRQLTAVWRLRGLADAARGRKASWGQMTRVGFATVEPGGGPVPQAGPVRSAGEVLTDAR